MDDFASGFLTGIDEQEEHRARETDDREDESQLDDQDDQQEEQAVSPESPKKTRGLRSGIFRAANLQDKLLEK